MAEIPDFSNHDVLVKSIRHDISLLIEDYLLELKQQKIGNDASNLLNILGSMQASVQEFYKQGLGEKETAMLYYGIADRIVGSAVDKGRIPPVRIEKKK